MEKDELEKALNQRIVILLEKAEKARTEFTESWGLLQHYITVYESAIARPLPEDLSSRVALLGRPRKRKSSEQ